MNEELKKELGAMLEDFKKGIPVGISKEELASEITKLEEKLADKFEPKDYSAEFKALKDKMVELEGIATRKDSKVETSLKDVVLEMFEEAGIKDIASFKAKMAQLGRFEYELKADNEATTASVTGTIGRTQEVSPVKFPKLRPTAFLNQGIRMGSVDNNKSVLLWTAGAYTSNAGYAGEFASIADGQSASATEKTRKLAKLGAFQILTEETFEDLGQFAERVVQKLTETMLLKADAEIWGGDGADSGATTQHVYGLKTQGVTAFNASLVSTVEKANIADLVDACSTQAELDEYKTNTVWMNPKMANKLRRTKDTTGQYVVNQLVTGELVMGGHRVIKNTGIGDNELLVGDINSIQLWMKRNFAVEIERVPSKDYWVYYIYARMQCLVEDEDKKSLIYVSDVAQAITDITTPVA